MTETHKLQIENAGTTLGIELGSTRIKAVLIDSDGNPLASGGYSWENSQVDGIWTYPLEEVKIGLQSCFADLARDVKEKFGLKLKRVKTIGISAMMHGYLVLDSRGSLLVPFRTWRNNITEQASEELTGLFDYPIPQRWSIAHLYQAILNNEEHTPRISGINTLAGWVHQQLTGENLLGIGDASGMFPIDPETRDFNSGMIRKFDEKTADRGFEWKLGGILPKVLCAGEPAGCLTEKGALLLDPSGNLEAGIPLFTP